MRKLVETAIQQAIEAGTDPAVAAIASMREPTGAMIKAGESAIYRGYGSFVIWETMIDEALKEVE